MSFQGLYDPNTFISGDYGTYPQPQVGSKYQPGMYWSFSVGGTFDGTPVSAGDRAYVEGRARQYGDATYGDDLYGDPAGQDWPVYVTTWVLWFANQFPWLQDPPLTGGCPLVPGWRIHVEWLRDDRVLPDDGNFDWQDVSDQVTEIVLARGGTDGRMVVDVDRLRVVFADIDGSLFPMYPVSTSANFGPGDRVRVGMSDGTTYYPVMTCRVEAVDDIHDVQPRLVALDCYGHVMDLVVPLLSWDRPGESAAARAEAIENALNWTWSEFSYETTPGYSLAPDSDGPRDVIARSELDRTAQSSGWSMRADKRGSIQFVDAPYTGTGGFGVTDCTGETELASPAIVIRNDLGEMLNSASVVTNWAGDPFSSDWDYQTPQNPGAPSAGEVIHPRRSGDDDTLRFHEVDNNGVNVAAFFAALKPGDQFAKQAFVWTIVSVTNNGDSTWSIEVTPAGSPQGDTGVHRFSFQLIDLESQSTDATSIARFGERAATQGFPIGGLATLNQADLDAITSNYVARYGLVATRVSAIELDSRLDSRWSAQVAGLELGQTVITIRRGLDGPLLNLQGTVVGYELVFEPDPRAEGNGRITGRLNLSGATKMILDSETRQTAAGEDRETAGSETRETAWGNVI